MFAASNIIINGEIIYVGHGMVGLSNVCAHLRRDQPLPSSVVCAKVSKIERR